MPASRGSNDSLQQERQKQFESEALTKFQHNAVDLHMIGESIGAPSRVIQLTKAALAAVGKSPYPAREDHVHDLGADVPDYASGSFSVTINATTPPTLGTGGVNSCFWIKMGKLLYVSISVTFGTGGGGGAGNWTFTVPNSFQIADVVPNTLTGSVRANDVSTGNLATEGVWLTSAAPSTTVFIRSIQAPNSASQTWGAALPFGVAWAATDSLSGSFIARIS